MANVKISRTTNGFKLQDILTDDSLGLNHGFSTNSGTTLEEILYISHDSLIPITGVKLFINNLTEVLTWADTTVNDGILLDLDNNGVYEINVNTGLGNSLANAINLPDINPASELVIRVKIKVPDGESVIGARSFNLNIEYTDTVPEAYLLINEFVINTISNIPCDVNFESLLPQRGTVTRSHDAGEGVKTRNDWGEVISTYSEDQIVSTNVPIRIEFLRQRGEVGYSVETKGGTVFSTHRIFMCPEVNIRENDKVTVGTRKYQVQLVEEYYDFDDLHHFELFARRIDFS